ncbi:MAG: response regulator [Synechococcales cyanobacterium C42_A2020_086]|jgi:CheY-like chemotaxis protein|nr:response regulator [Synechococcales cyanobacterium M58_A2018_015]MBF2072403.1 response regulator [Synechococcales cyanobacterium C42_A2020_086]
MTAQRIAKRILIIDDEERIREVVRACLEDLGGWQTLTAASGEEGWQQATREPLDAILLDVSMPDLDGITLFHRLHAHPATSAIPVVLLTAKVLPDDKAQFAQLGIAGIITKPFDPMRLVPDIAALLQW